MDVHSLIAVDSGWRIPRVIDLPLPNAQVSGPNPPPPNTVTITITVNVTDALGLTEVATATASIGTVTPPTLITMGDTNIESINDGGNGNLLFAQKATLAATATIQSMSFYVRTVGGGLRLGVYDASGSGGGPGKLVASCPAFTPVVGWNTVSVSNQVLLAAGTYWLAYLPQNNALGFQNVLGVGSEVHVSFTYAALPTTFPSYGGAGAFRSDQWSFYATLQE